MILSLAVTLAQGSACLRPELFFLRFLPLLVLQHSAWPLSQEDSLYSILIALVFGFSSLNIVGLVTRRSEDRRSSLSFGEILALTAMALSVCFLAFEMLHLFHIFPIKLQLEPR
jgi:hypothetical protein